MIIDQKVSFIDLPIIYVGTIRAKRDNSESETLNKKSLFSLVGIDKFLSTYIVGSYIIPIKTINYYRSSIKTLK